MWSGPPLPPAQGEPAPALPLQEFPQSLLLSSPLLLLFLLLRLLSSLLVLLLDLLPVLQSLLPPPGTLW